MVVKQRWRSKLETGTVIQRLLLQYSLLMYICGHRSGWLLLRSIVGGMYAECLFSGVGEYFAICPSIAELASLVASPTAVSLEMKG